MSSLEARMQFAEQDDQELENRSQRERNELYVEKLSDEIYDIIRNGGGDEEKLNPIDRARIVGIQKAINEVYQNEELYPDKGADLIETVGDRGARDELEKQYQALSEEFTRVTQQSIDQGDMFDAAASSESTKKMEEIDKQMEQIRKQISTTYPN